jgi:hypothetical protein
MNTETTAAETPAVDPNEATAQILASYNRPVARLLKHTPRVTEGRKSAEERALGGRYRIIHGQVTIAVPVEQRLLPDGQINPHLPSQVYADMGDEVELDHVDAAFFLDNDIVEPLNARPSRVGKVWDESDRSKRAWDYARCEALKERNAQRTV